LEESTGWPIAYHGTTPSGLTAILRDGKLKAGLVARNGTCYGAGVYTSPNIDFARGYAKDGGFEGNKIVFLVRVRPGSFTENNGGNEWVVTNDNDVRLVAILFKP